MPRKKSKNGERQVRLCKCGCGQQVRLEFNRKGEFSGYGVLAPGCRRTYTVEFRKKISSLMKGPNGINAVPPGTRRKDRHGKKLYWRVKLSSGRPWASSSTERKGWIYEHRYVMECALGRVLKRSEHVHHINGDTLDNRLENLIVLSASDHLKLTGKERAKRGELAQAFYPICEVCGFPHPPH